MESLVIRHDLRKIWTAAVGLVLLAALEGAFLWLVHDLSNPVSAVLTLVLGILWAALLLLAAANVLAAVRLGGAPALVVDDRGVTDRTTLGSVGLIPWEQALAFVPGRGTSRGFVIVHYADPRWPGRRLRGLGRAVRWVNRALGRFGLPPGVIGTGTFDLDVVETARLLVDQRALRRPDLPTASGPAPGSALGRVVMTKSREQVLAEAHRAGLLRSESGRGASSEEP